MKFLEWLGNSSKVIIFDGAMGTEIIKQGIKPGELPDFMNIKNPDIITEIHKSYYEAGSDICQTNTFGSNLLNLQKYKLADKIKEINKAALKNIEKSCPSEKLIAGDIGPTGEFKAPIGNATYEDWYSSFSKQVQILKSGVDLWHVETISDLDEMLAALNAIKDNSDKPIISSMTYRKTKKGFFTIMGDSVKQCIQKVDDNCEIIGSNCTLGSKDMIELLKEIKKYTKKPISIKPNAGKPRLDTTNQVFYEQPIEEYVTDIMELIKLGTKIVGGCCGTSP
ncbi:MAG: homocysteine S-methyltransferase family protein, partial [Candidatus Lokiarchaeota archaeon]